MTFSALTHRWLGLHLYREWKVAGFKSIAINGLEKYLSFPMRDVDVELGHIVKGRHTTIGHSPAAHS